MRRTLSYIFIIGVVAFVAGCRSGVGDEVRPVRIQRLDHIVASGTGVPPEMSAAAEFYGRVTSLSSIDPDLVVRSFQPAIDSVITDLSDVERLLGVARKNLARLLPAASEFGVYSVVSSFDRSVYISDTIVLVALNHYLGADFEGYSRFPAYVRRLKTLRQLPLDVTEGVIASAYPREPAPDGEMTVLGHMLYQGAVIEAKRQALPGIPEAEILGYTPEQWQWLVEHEADLWRKLVSDDKLYSISKTDIDRLLSPAPFTPMLSSEAPGRAGRFLGYRIVSAYLAANEDTALEELLSPVFYNSGDVLRKAMYNPVKR